MLRHSHEARTLFPRVEELLDPLPKYFEVPVLAGADRFDPLATDLDDEGCGLAAISSSELSDEEDGSSRCSVFLLGEGVKLADGL